MYANTVFCILCLICMFQHLKREALLSMALSHNMIGFLIGCVNQWADGKFSHAGLNLRFLLDWGWSKIGQIKESLDRLCEYFFFFD